MKTFCLTTFAIAALLTLAPSILATPCADVTFTNTVNIPGPAQYQTGLAFADFNNDGKKDAIFSNENNETISLRLGDGLGGFSGSTDISGTGHPWGLAAADFDHDGNMDFAATGNPFGYVHVRFGDGLGGFSAPTAYYIAGPWNTSVVTADFNGDGHTDLISASNGASSVGVLLNDGSGSFSVTNIPVGGGSLGVAVGDLNGDGNSDFATANFVDGTISVRLGNGSGGFAAVADIVSGSNTWGVGIGNFNGDAYPDIASTNRAANTITIFLGDGAGNFALSSTTPTTAHPMGVAVEDLDNDGIDDVIAVPQDSNEMRVFRGNGSGGLVQIAALYVDYNSFIVSTSDLNGDGYIDFGISNQAGFNNQVRIFLGGCNTPPDTTPPTIEIVQPTESTYLLNQSVTVQFSCDDAESGVATCVGSSPNGSMLNTSSAGSYSFTVNATDVAGNVSESVVHYTVGYGIVAMYDQTKAHKSGSTVPIKIRLVDANGVNVSSASTVVHAISVVQTSTMASTKLDDAGNANPDFDF
jgi:hypothetical protein